MPYSRLFTTLAALGLLLANASALATTNDPQIRILDSKYSQHLPKDKISALLQQHFVIQDYREVRGQVIYNDALEPDHILVYLFSKNSHSVKMAMIAVDKNFNAVAVHKHYQLRAEDFSQQPGISEQAAQCPDKSVEFIAFAPNNIQLELDVTKDVAQAAKKQGLQTVELLIAQATRSNYLNYMKCPNLKGNFYDGDANPDLIVTYDGLISSDDINKELANKFNYHVTNIWLACEAFNNPMKASMLDVAKSQKYAAGINDLLVGPSDYAAACAMKKAIGGEPMTASFQACYAQYDKPEDQWGFDGKGNDIFGT
jgi:hypothetical protein